VIAQHNFSRDLGSQLSMSVFNPGSQGLGSISTMPQPSTGGGNQNNQNSVARSEEHTSELQSLTNLVCRLLLEKKRRNTFTANPSSVHGPCREARVRLVEGIESVARSLGCAPKHVVFPSGSSAGSELGVTGTWRSGRIVTTPFEHPCVLGTLDQLKADVVRTGDPLTALEGARLVCTMAVNNETGAIFPVADIASECTKRGIPFFCDAVQAAG